MKNFLVCFNLTNIEQEVFVLVPCRFTSAALSDFSSLPRVEISGSVPLILTTSGGWPSILFLVFNILILQKGIS
jgi:hypothetical protein